MGSIYNEIRIFLIGSKIRFSWDIHLFFFSSGWIVVFCFYLLVFGVPEPSGNVRKTAKTENKFNGYWCLHQKFSGSGQLFCSWEFFLIFFFFEISSIKCSFRIINWFFSLFEAWHQKKGPKSKKWAGKQKKDTKAGITRECHQLRPRF